MKKLFAMLLLSFGWSLSSFAAPCGMTNTHFSDAAQAIQVSAVAPEFTLRLKSNPTTGYSWSVKKYDTQLLTLVNNQFFPPDSNCLGASGYEVWTFKVNSTGLNNPLLTFIEMEYARPWEKRGGIVTKFTVMSR